MKHNTTEAHASSAMQKEYSFDVISLWNFRSAVLHINNVDR